MTVSENKLFTILPFRSTTNIRKCFRCSLKHCQIFLVELHKPTQIQQQLLQEHMLFYLIMFALSTFPTTHIHQSRFYPVFSL